MKEIKIITDSCSDLSGELLEKYDIDYAKMSTVYEGKNTPASLTWDEYSPSEFYSIMRAGNRITTTQVPVEEFQKVFGEYIEKGYDVLYIGCSSKLSGSVNTANVVAKKMMSDNPDAKIICIDSINASVGEGMLAIKAAELVREGLDIDTIADKVTKMRNTVRQYVTVHNLDALHRAGRVKGSAAFFGNLFGVKPILISDADGNNVPIKKAKGRLGSMKEIVAQLKATALNTEEQTIYIVHADCSKEEVEQLREMIKAEIPCKDIYPTYLGPIIGASIGPDAIGVFGFGEEVTYRVGE